MGFILINIREQIIYLANLLNYQSFEWKLVWWDRRKHARLLAPPRVNICPSWRDMSSCRVRCLCTLASNIPVGACVQNQYCEIYNWNLFSEYIDLHSNSVTSSRISWRARLRLRSELKINNQVYYKSLIELQKSRIVFCYQHLKPPW